MAKKKTEHTIHRFTDFAKPDFYGEKISINDILYKDITVVDFTIMPSKFHRENTSECLKLLIIFNGQQRIVFTGSVNLMMDCKKYHDQMPFITKIVNDGRRYLFS